MKNRMVLVSLSFFLLTGVLLWQAGCRLGGGDGDALTGLLTGAGPGIKSPLIGKATTVRFKILPPDYGAGTALPSQGKPAAPTSQDGVNPASGRAGAGNMTPAIRASASSTPTVTFKLILVNFGNTSNPTTTLTKTVPAINGVATVEFSGVPLATVIGDLHINGGHIASQTDFHGALDLAYGVDNTIDVAAKTKRQKPDIVATVITRICADGTLFPKATFGLTSRVSAVLAGLDFNASAAYDDAVARYTNSLTAALTQTQEQAAVEPVRETLALALTAGEVDTAADLFVPAVREKYRSLFNESPDLRAALASALQTASLTYVADPSAGGGTFSGGQEGSRYGEMTLVINGFEFQVMLEKTNGRWLIRSL